MKIDRIDEMLKLDSLMNQDVIKVITGIRRCGKSTLLDLFAKRLIERYEIDSSQIIRINLDQYEFHHIKNYNQLYEYIIEKIEGSKQHYIFIDEVQNVLEFEKAIEALYAKKNLDLYITGSNSELLSSEIATKLSGRTIQIAMTPFSFKEYSQIASSTDSEIALRDYIEYGGFPGAYPIFEHSRESVDDYLAGIFETVIMKDVAKRKTSVDLNILRMIVDFTFNNVGSLTSPNNISNSLTANGFKVSVNAVLDYLSILEKAFVLYRAKRYDIKGRKLLQRVEKFYLVDTGLRRITASRRQGADIGHALENIVYFELLRRYDNVWVGKIGDQEIDFVAENIGGEIHYYQVCYLLSNEEIISREFGVFEKVNDNHRKTLLSLDKFDMSRNGIQHHNLINWLLSDDNALL